VPRYQIIGKGQYPKNAQPYYGAPYGREQGLGYDQYLTSEFPVYNRPGVGRNVTRTVAKPTWRPPVRLIHPITGAQTACRTGAFRDTADTRRISTAATSAPRTCTRCPTGSRSCSARQLFGHREFRGRGATSSPFNNGLSHVQDLYRVVVSVPCDEYNVQKVRKQHARHGMMPEAPYYMFEGDRSCELTMGTYTRDQWPTTRRTSLQPKDISFGLNRTRFTSGEQSRGKNERR